MRVEIRAAALQSAESHHATLLGIFAYALMRRHRVFLDDEPNILDAWAPTATSSRIRDEVELALELSRDDDAKGPLQHHTIIVDDVREPTWSARPCLDPEMAFSLLGRPLRVLLEHGRNDGNFLLAFCRSADRNLMTRFADRGWIDFANGGGITGLHVLLQDEEREDVLLRTFVLCDSDAQQPDAPSQQALDVCAQIQRHATAPILRPARFGHMLRARAAENYADCRKVLPWALNLLGQASRSECHEIIEQSKTAAGRSALLHRPGATGTPRRKLLFALAWRDLEEAQRFHLDAKHGIAAKNAPSLVDGLDDFQRAALAEGFGPSFSKSFYPTQLEQHDPTGEIPAVIVDILGRL